MNGFKKFRESLNQEQQEGLSNVKIMPINDQQEANLEAMKPVEKIRILFNKHLPHLLRNDINGEWEKDGQVLTEEDINSHILEFQSEATGISEALFYRFLKSNNIKNYNPIRDFFESKSDIDNKGLISALASCIETDTGVSLSNNDPVNYVEHFLRKWLVGAVAQAFGKGVNPLMIVLAGVKQNTGKTTFFRNLVPQELKAYMAEPKGLSEMKDADLGMILCENLIVFDDEMSGRSWKDWQRMKSMLSMESFTMRRPYERRQRKYSRIASLCATNNQLDLLGDPTGNRRLIPINVISIDHNKYNGIDKVSLWLEAYYFMLNGFDHHLKQEDIELLNSCTKDFESVDEVIELIQEYFHSPEECQLGRFTATQIASVLMKNSTFKNLHPNKIGERLRKLGYQQKRDNQIGGRTWVIDIKDGFIK